MGDKKIVYISHPYGNSEVNKLHIEKIITSMCKSKKITAEYLIVSPVHNFGFMYDDVDYETGINFCIDLLGASDIMIVFGDWKSSRGCTMEVEHCLKTKKPYVVIEDEDPDNIYNKLSDMVKNKANKGT